MKTRLILAALAMVALLLPLAAAAQHDEGAGPEGMPPMGAPEEMKTLAFMHGEWHVVMEMRMGPEAPWTKTEGTAVITSILSGCANYMQFTGTVMGMPFEGTETSSYNRETGKFESMWIDNMSAHATHMSGAWVDGKMVMEGTDLYQGNKLYNRTTSTKLSDDELNWQMESSMDGENYYTGLRMTYTRKSS